MHVITRAMVTTDRISVSNGQGTTATYPWDYSLDDRMNHLAAALDFAREQFGFTPAVVSEYSQRPSGVGYNVTLSRSTQEA